MYRIAIQNKAVLHTAILHKKTVVCEILIDIYAYAATVNLMLT